MTMFQLGRALWAGSAALVAAAAAPSPADAQYYGGYGGYAPYGYYNAPPPPPPPPGPYMGGGRYGGYPSLPPRAIVDRLDDMGFDDIGRPHFTGTLYIVDATGPAGMRVRLTVDAVRGIILNRTALGRPLDPDDGLPRPRRYGGWPDRDPRFDGRADPRLDGRPLVPGEDYDPRRDGRGAARPLPADPRLAPSPGERPFEGRQDRTGTRSAPPAVSGTNPGTAPQPARPPAQQQARRPDAPVAPPKPPPAAKPEAAQPEAAKPTAEVKPKPKGPVRVIEGVTPMIAPKDAGQNMLNELPAPPAVEGVEVN